MRLGQVASVILTVATLGASTAVAQPAPPPPPPPLPIVDGIAWSSTTADTGSRGFTPRAIDAASELRGSARPEPAILAVLKRDFTGQPVIAVSDPWPGLDVDTVKVRASEKLLSRVQDVADAFSTPDQQCVPYAVRGAWVLAPGTRSEVRTDFSEYSPLDVSGRARIFTQLLASLSAREVDFLCSQNGLLASGLDRKLQAMVSRAVRPPFAVVQLQANKEHPDYLDEAPNSSRVITTVPGLDGVRIRAQLRSIAPCLVVTRRQSPDSDYEYTNTYDIGQMPAVPHIEMRPTGEGTGFYNTGADLPAVYQVPNTFKPSDLDGKILAQPFGMHGVMTIEAAVKQIAAKTGRQFKASSQYAQTSVFIGADTVTCGEVADGLRLALTGTWRRLGSLYFLTWDKMGLGALQTFVMERAQELTHASDKAANDAENSDAWLDLAMRIPFAADDPIAWTAGQRRILFGPNVKKPNGGSDQPYVLWSGLTTGQQAFIRSFALGRKVSMPDPASEEGEWHERELTERDITAAGLRGQAKVELQVQMADGPWMTVGDWWYKNLDQGSLEGRRWQIKSRLDEEKRKADEEKRYGSRPRPINMPYRQPERTLSPAKRRALMVPVMPRDRLAKLATQMRVRGITTLFYPVLSNGYATFPSKAFPPHPAMGTPNNWLTCVNIMKGAGVTVVGYMETLAWRKPDEKGHWLEQHADWLDLDILGRSLTEHVRAECSRMLTPVPAITGDLVRASEPQVQTRLTTLLAEYMRQPGSSALCLDAWDYATSLRQRSRYFGGYMRTDNPLGCAVPDRLASVLANGYDPVDLSTGGFPTPPFATVSMPRPYMSEERFRLSIDSSIRVPSPPGSRPAAPQYDLASRLLPKARPDGAPWTTYAVVPSVRPQNMYGNAGPANPAATVTISLSVQGGPMPGVASTMMVRVPSRKERTAESGGNPQEANQPAMVAAEGEQMRYGNAMPANLVVYDFRGAPEEIDDSLRRVGLPADVPDEPTRGVRTSG